MPSTPCHHHPLREAAAKCTSCEKAFCRECVTDLDGRMVCGACYAKKTRQEAKTVRDWFLVSTMFQAVVGLMILWFTAWVLGRFLVSTPSSFHEGTVWERVGD